MSALLTVENLTAGYKDVPVVQNISFSIQENEIMAIVGESGSGKSTLIKTIAQVKGDRTDVMAGHIAFEGNDLAFLSDEEKRHLYGKRMSLIFQNPEASLHPLRRVRAQFNETVEAHKELFSGMSDKAIEAYIRQIFEHIGLTDVERILNAYPFELSGGMAQRVAIALAVLLKPKLILADEPTSALDTTVQKQVIEELLLLREHLGTAILIITHNIGVAAKIADRIGVMQKGRIIELGPTKEVLAHPKHEYTKALLKAVPKLGGSLPKAVHKKHFSVCHSRDTVTK